MITARVIVREGPGQARVIPLPPGIVEIGREVGNHLVLSHVDLSKRHCQLRPLAGGGHSVFDLGSTNGVRLNGRRVAESALRPFDHLSLGEVSLIYLDTEIDADRVRALLAADLAQTESSLASGESDALLHVLLWIQELGNTSQLRPHVHRVLGELRAAAGADRAYLFAVRRGARRFEVGDNIGDDFDSGDVSSEAWVRAALAGGRVAHGLTSLGRTICVPIQSPGFEGEDRRAAWLGGVGGALFLAGDDLARVEPEQVKFLWAIGRQFAMLLFSAQLQQEASVDGLTGLLTRRAIESALEVELEIAEREESPLAVALLDVDDFKHVNDRFGHSQGDEVLRRLSRMLRGGLRHEDAVGRWGGEEILIALPRTGASGALTIIQKLVAAVAKRPAASACRVTISAGVSAYPRDATQSADLIRCADQALYYAKSRGKNRCEVFSPTLARGPRVDPADRGRTSVCPAVRELPGATAEPRGWLHNEDYSPIPLARGVHVVGRGRSCDLILSDSVVSRRHARIRVDAAIRVEDLGSRNGTYVNDTRVEGAVTLEFGDHVRLGRACFQLREEGASETETGRSPVSGLDLDRGDM